MRVEVSFRRPGRTSALDEVTIEEAGIQRKGGVWRPVAVDSASTTGL
jgi:hypothetical protein